jgi:hypothetical protein
MHTRQRGQAAAEVLVVSVIIVLGVSMVLLRTWAVVDTKFRVNGAAREAVRAYVEAPNGDVAMDAARVAAARSMGVGAESPLPLDAPPLVSTASGFARCQRVSLTVRWAVPAVRFGNRSLGRVVVSGTHSEVVDPYRRGRTGEATCDA